MAELKRLQFEDLYEPLASDSDVDGIAHIYDGNTTHPVPFGESVPEDGASDKGFGVWWWDGDRDEPTLKPSVNLGDMHIHLKDGNAVST